MFFLLPLILLSFIVNVYVLLVSNFIYNHILREDLLSSSSNLKPTYKLENKDTMVSSQYIKHIT